MLAEIVASYYRRDWMGIFPGEGYRKILHLAVPTEAL